MTFQTQLKRMGKYAIKQDIYAYNPTYEWASYKTATGVVLSWLTVAFILFYIVLTTRDYVVRPPELVSQGDIDIVQTAEEFYFKFPRIGVRLGYTSEEDPSQRTVALGNANPFVKIHFRHVVMQHQERVRETVLLTTTCIVSNEVSVCPVVDDTFKLQGTIHKHQFQYMEISIDKCTDDPICLPLEEINSRLQSGEFRVRALLGLEAEQFDVERFHATGIGSAQSNRTLEYFNLPNIEVKSDIIFKARKVQKEQRYLGSPPMPETQVNILSFDRRENSYRPRSAREKSLIFIQVRLDDNISLEEVSYWCPSVLDLFGLWGAMASFIASLSLGFFAMMYNKWSFERHFKRMAYIKRREAQLLTLSTMEWVKDKEDEHSTRNRQEIYKNLQVQFDALMVEPDIRMFESHHFDRQGRVEMSAAELKFPSTPFGELRRIASTEHGKRKRAALFLSWWYGRLLVKRGFIKDPERRRELFRPLDGVPSPIPRRRRPTHLPKITPLRRRKRTSSKDLCSSTSDIESGLESQQRMVSHDISSDADVDGIRRDLSLEFPCVEEQVAMEEEQGIALRVIDELDPVKIGKEL